MKTYLITIGLYYKKHNKRSPPGEGLVSRDGFLFFPATVSEGVKTDVMTKPNKELESNVITISQTSLEIDFKAETQT